MFEVVFTVVVALVGCALLVAIAFPEFVFILFEKDPQERQDPDQAVATKEPEFEELVGKTGVVKTPLKLSGSIVFADDPGRTFEALSEGAFVEEGTDVVVIAVSDRRLVVRPSSS